MNRTILVSVIGQLSEYQVEQIWKMAGEFLTVQEELSETTQKAVLAAIAHRHASSRRASLVGSNGISAWLAVNTVRNHALEGKCRTANPLTPQ